MKQNTKEWIQYSSAIGLIMSGILMGFLSFFLNDYDLTNGVLTYIAEAFVAGGGLMGVAIYVKNTVGEFETRAADGINKIVKRIEKLELK